jgi:hypothetical protein
MATGIDWTTVLVALITGGAAAGAPVWIWYKQGSKESESVRAALFAEVDALIEIVDLRGFLPSLREMEHTLRNRVSPLQEFRGEESILSFEVKIDSQFNRVYQGNVSRLGVLSTLEAKQIVRFHQLADSVRLDVIPGGLLAEGTSDPDKFKETADLLETALRIGRELTAPKS